jgi:hypothetical protein
VKASFDRRMEIREYLIVKRNSINLSKLHVVEDNSRMDFEESQIFIHRVGDPGTATHYFG